ncbi:AAA family ATPase [uncultured Sutterella sp.]|uniref:AAA family ATPase n=1 Tax=uncultured Sutterella sp. TaxID=286133 RepID=UPI0026320264|nr:AAA family ATPase [uncultured Sutterella sp.]
MQKKSIALGNSSFPLMRRSHSCYVDKTTCIRPLIESGNFAQVILRPRGFGKSLFISTIRSFLSIDAVSPGNTSLQKELFDGLGIMEDKAFCDRYMGKVPVLSLSFKDLFGQNFQYAFASIANQIAVAANSFSFLLDSPRLSSFEKRRLQEYIKLDKAETIDNRMKAARFPSDMTTFLARHFGRPAILLIDDCDVPLAKAAAGGYYKEMQGFMQKFLSVLKPEHTPPVNNLPVIAKAILAGCLHVGRGSTFTGLNNLSVNTVCTDNVNLAAAMGFTDGEVDALLRNCGLESRKEDVRRWYGGYRFGSSDIYCPRDVLSFCQSSLESDDPKRLEPDNFWINTSSNDLIDEFLGFLTENDADRMQLLLNGGSIELKINEQLTYSDLALHQSDDFWTLLLFTGYLTAEKYLGDRAYRLRIPNEEIRETFENRVAARLKRLERA